MKQMILRFLRLFIGIFVCSVGIVMTINANLGLAPWDVFHQGLANKVGITIGQATIVVGVFFVILDSFLGERLGWGTLFNMIFIGLFIDILMINNIIPICQSFISGLIMMVSGMFIIGIGCYLYIGAELGSGPRDGLMVALTKRTNKSVQFLTNFIQMFALVGGYFLGGYVGIGTLITALCFGNFIQLAFKVFKFDVSKTNHRFIDDDIKLLKKIILKSKDDRHTEDVNLQAVTKED
jgi:uncharacterized membrane protein YczE